MDANPRNGLCLDFVNVLKDHDWESGASSRAFERLIEWISNSDAFDIDDVRKLRVLTDRNPDAIDLVLLRSRELHGSLNRIFANIVTSDRPQKGDLGALNRMVARTLAHLRIVDLDTGYSWTWKNEPSSPDRILWPVIRSAAELLVSKQCSRIRKCASVTCSWLFLDTSRNGRRRWCDMATCGNRAKARRFYERHREGG